MNDGWHWFNRGGNPDETGDYEVVINWPDGEQWTGAHYDSEINLWTDENNDPYCLQDVAAYFVCWRQYHD